VKVQRIGGQGLRVFLLVYPLPKDRKQEKEQQGNNVFDSLCQIDELLQGMGGIHGESDIRKCRRPAGGVMIRDGARRPDGESVQLAKDGSVKQRPGPVGLGKERKPPPPMRVQFLQTHIETPTLYPQDDLTASLSPATGDTPKSRRLSIMPLVFSSSRIIASHPLAIAGHFLSRPPLEESLDLFGSQRAEAVEFPVQNGM
jgi:hypothetical protein